MGIKEKIKGLTGIDSFLIKQRIELESQKMLIARGVVSQMRQMYDKVNQLEEVEFSVFSQLGDDGIIQYLIHALDITTNTFIEFGVQNYLESNTRFLLQNNNWRGLIIDGSQENIDFVKSDYYYWKHDLKAKHLFITAENINEAFEEEGFKGEIGLLHIDIDGNDYWVWKAIQSVNPVIAIMEYNSGFGFEKAITVPYRSDFERYDAHYSGLYYGASLPAFCDLATEKGYTFIGSNSYGNNAYFVRNDKLKNLKAVSCEDGYRYNYCRQNKNEQGELTFTSDLDAIKTIDSLKVFNTRNQQIETLVI